MFRAAAVLLGLLPAPQEAPVPPPATLIAEAPAERFPATLANGEIGATVPPRGFWPGGRHPFRVVPAGVWNGPLLNDDGWPNYQLYLPELPAPAKLELRALGVDLSTAPLLDGYRQELDLARGLLTTRFAVADSDGGRIEVRVEQLMSRARRELFATRVTVRADRAGELSARCILDLENTRGVRWMNSRQQPARGRHALRLRTLVPETPDCAPYDLEVAQGLEVEGEGTEPRAWQGDDRIWFDTSLRLEAGRPRSFTIATSYRSSRRGPLGLGHDFGPVETALAAGFDALLAEHAAAWAGLWQSRVLIEGDEELQRVADASLFHLVSAIGAGDADSMGPMGLTKVDRNNYAGHVFWDAETWMFPPLLLLHPEFARSMLDYRHARLEGARQNAILRGVTEGLPWQTEVAYFPWESARTGQEATPRWFVAADEIHNNACIALAFWQFGELHGDAAFWRDRAWPVLRGIADFYCARGERDADGSWHLRGVTGADEYAEDEDDFPYVNGSARRTLEIAAALAEALGETAPARWREMAAGLAIPFDDEHRRHPEYLGYDGRTIKQADVVLMSYPWGLVGDPEVVRNDLEYYQPRTAENAPAMSHAIHAVLWAGLGDEERALAELDRSWRDNVEGPFLTWSETPTNDCINFTTGMGGFLQALIFGFGGIRVVEGGLEARPLLPRRWRAFEVRGLSLGAGRAALRVDGDGARVLPIGGAPDIGRLRLPGG
jgi:trehalose/maltose hydrolase-like predicted phosphorylase